MTITRVSVCSVDLPGKGGGYRRTTGLSPAANVSTIVEIDSNEGVSGHGEDCPLGTHYMRGWAGGAQAGNRTGTIPPYPVSVMHVSA